MRVNKNSSKKLVLVLTAVVLVLSCAIGGTLAWLMDKTETVTNTFTVGNVDIDLKEHDLKADGTLDEGAEVTSEDTYKIIPGTSQPKDPFVRVEAGSEACWVFIQVTEENNADTYIDYSIDTTVWTLLDQAKYPNVYYKEMDATSADVTLNILLDETVTYPATLTRGEIDQLYTFTADENGNVIMTMKSENELPKLSFMAYAIQKANGNGTFSAEEAWLELIKKDNGLAIYPVVATNP